MEEVKSLGQHIQLHNALQKLIITYMSRDAWTHDAMIQIKYYSNDIFLTHAHTYSIF